MVHEQVVRISSTAALDISSLDARLPAESSHIRVRSRKPNFLGVRHSVHGTPGAISVFHVAPGHPAVCILGEELHPPLVQRESMAKEANVS